MTAAERIAAWATGLEPDAVPEDVRTDAKLHVLDAIGCGLAAHATGVAHEGRATMSELGGRPEATVIVLAILFGVRVLMRGVSTIMFGFGLRRIHQTTQRVYV